MNIQSLYTSGTTNSLNQTKYTNQDELLTTSPTAYDQVTISSKGLAKFSASLKVKTGSHDDLLTPNFQKFLVDYNHPDAVEQRRLEQLEKEQAYNPLTDEFNLLVKRKFPENTLYHTISEALEGKVVNEWVYAAQLTNSLRSAVSNQDKSAKERAAYREMALKQAEYIAENYLDNEAERTAFMDEINRHYENDLLREKGYVVFDNSDLEPFKKYSSPRDGGKVSYMTFAKKYMNVDTYERWMNNATTKEETNKFLRQLAANYEKWSKEIIETVGIEVKEAEKAITDVKEMFETFVWKDGRIITTGEEQPDYLDELIKWNENMLNLFL